MKKLETNALIIFARNPVQGKVKSRITSESSHVFALNCYHELLISTYKTIEKIKAKKYLYFSDYIPPEINSLDGCEILCQSGRGYGERMMNAIKDSLQNSKKSIVLSGDCIELNPEIIDEAFKALNKVDVVIGPAFDGKHYLLGMKRIHRSLFKNVDWDGRHVLKETLHEVTKNGLTFHVLKTLHDANHLETIPVYLLKRIYDFNYHPGA